jgi:hypothetical protein
MNINRTIVLSLLFLPAVICHAQTDNPFESIGKKGKILTLSNGKYVETFDYDSVERIGSVIINIRTRKVVRLLKSERTFSKFSDNSSASRWWSPDPLANKFPEWSPYNYVKNNPIKFNDPDGRAPEWIVGTDGKKVNYTKNADGSLTWSKNASADVQKVGNALNQTSEGQKELGALNDAKHPISIKVDNEHVIQEADGSYKFGNTLTTPKITIDPKTGAETREFAKSEITIYEKTITEHSIGTSYILGNGEKVDITNLTVTDRIGDAAVHEATHATDKQSSGALNPNATYEEKEKKPYANQAQYIREIFKIRNPSSNEQ